MKRLLCILLLFLLCFCISTYSYAAELLSRNEVSSENLTPPIWMQADILIDNENIPVATSSIMLSKQEMGFSTPYGNAQKFTNLVDGYSIVIPSDMNVDMSLSDVCATFSNQTRTLRVFKETFITASDRLSYLTYSNLFIENTTEHTKEVDTSFNLDGVDYHILQWSRRALKNVANDKNFYACIDVCIGARVYTFFFTSSTPFASQDDYMNIVKSLVTSDPVVPKENAYNHGYKMSDLSHLNPTTKATYDKLFSESSEFKMGIFSPEVYGGYNKMYNIENYIGYDFCTFLQYTECTDSYGMSNNEYQAKVSNYINNIQLDFEFARNKNKHIELTLQPPLNRATGANMVYEILDGNYDYFISQYITLIQKNADVTVLFRPFNEMNGDWCSYSAYHTSRDPQIYIELYKYLYKKFEKAGCKNVIWVWNPNEKSYPDFKWNNEALYYPGDEYVDVYGITGYNNGTYYKGETWRSFDEIYEPIYKRALKINEKPIMITEFSCSAIGGDKIAWIEDMFNALPKYDKIKLAIWWHHADYDGEKLSRPYFIDTPEGTLDVFKKYLGKGGI